MKRLLLKSFYGEQIASKSQILLVKKNNFTFYQKTEGIWKELLKTNCFYGKNGYSNNKKEGDGTTPIGVFELLYAFGIEENPKTKMVYKRILNTSYYSSDISKPNEYNKWVESTEKIIGEHLLDYKKEYHYGIVIGYNINPVIIGKGSGIFLHCKGDKKYTAGCIAVDEIIMPELLKQLKPGAFIIIEDDDTVNAP